MIYVITLAVYRDLADPSNIYLHNLNGIGISIFICYASVFLGISSLKSYSKYKKSNIYEWIRNRYKSISISSWIYFSQGLITLISIIMAPNPDSLFRIIITLYFAANLTLIFSIINFYSWFVLSRQNVDDLTGIKESYEDVVGDDYLVKQLDAPRILINNIGKVLSKAIDKPILPSIGLIRQSLKDQFGAIINLSQLKYQDIKNAFSISLKKRLLDLNIQDVDDVVRKMINELDKNKDILTIAVV
ncbi:MAG: hypothetical protein ACFFCS_22195 [Candidatus Hodarchaeota archaeon]